MQGRNNNLCVSTRTYSLNVNRHTWSMATMDQMSEFSVETHEMIATKKRSTVNRKFWRWFLAGALLNVCVISLAFGLMTLYVQNVLDSVKGDQGSPGTIQSKGLKGCKNDTNPSVTDVNRDCKIGDRTNLSPSGGDTYVRWGRTTCPDGTGTELVYQGIGGGADFEDEGGSVDIFCLPTDPDWSLSFNDGVNYNSFLYGLEYQLDSFDPFSHANAEYIHQHDAPCAVCRLVERRTQLLFPAKLGCPENWAEEYRGFLMSGRNDHKQRSQAVCVDQAPEVVIGSGGNENGALLYLLEGRCGSLLCPPYVEGREITCTVCSI